MLRRALADVGNRTSCRPASSRRKTALAVAMGVRTLPNSEVSPMTSTSGLLNAARIAMASSAHQPSALPLGSRLEDGT